MYYASLWRPGYYLGHVLGQHFTPQTLHGGGRASVENPTSASTSEMVKLCRKFLPARSKRACGRVRSTNLRSPGSPSSSGSPSSKNTTSWDESHRRIRDASEHASCQGQSSARPICVRNKCTTINSSYTRSRNCHKINCLLVACYIRAAHEHKDYVPEYLSESLLVISLLSHKILPLSNISVFYSMSSRSLHGPHAPPPGRLQQRERRTWRSVMPGSTATLSASVSRA